MLVQRVGVNTLWSIRSIIRTPLSDNSNKPSLLAFKWLARYVVFMVMKKLIAGSTVRCMRKSNTVRSSNLHGGKSKKWRKHKLHSFNFSGNRMHCRKSIYNSLLPNNWSKKQNLAFDEKWWFYEGMIY